VTQLDIEHLTFQHGPLSFSAQAMGSGPIVLCLHGFPDNLSSFRFQLPALAQHGYRAIALCLRGYEPRAIPADGDYTVDTIATDIFSVIEQLGAGSVHLVGHDWGAAIAYRAAALRPDCFRSLTTMAVPHAGRFAREGLRLTRQLRCSWYMGFFNIPWLSDWVVGRQDYAFIRRLWQNWSPGWAPEPHILEGVIDTLSQPGVCAAALGYYRAALSVSALLESAEEAHYAVPVPTLALSGELDGCILSDVFEQLTVPADFPAGVRFERVPGAGHFLHQERPDALNGLILEWLSSAPEG